MGKKRESFIDDIISDQESICLLRKKMNEENSETISSQIYLNKNWN
jgi:hypothetical protein